MGLDLNTGLVLDVVIGLAFLYFLLSLVCSAANEALASVLKWRAKDLKLAIVNLLGSERADRFYADARVQVLGKVKRSRRPGAERQVSSSGRKVSGSQVGYRVDGTSPLRRKPPEYGHRKFHLRDPSYIPAETFARVAFDLLASEPQVNGKAAFVEGLGLRGGAASATRETSASALQNDDPLAAASLRSAGLTALKPGVRRKLERAQDELEGEFDRAMERVGGWYKRKAVIWVTAIATVVVVALNVDTVNVTKRLLADPAAATAIAAQASRVAAEAPEPQGNAAPSGGDSAQDDTEAALQKLSQNVTTAREAGFPIGWTDLPWNGDRGLDNVAAKLAGFLLTIIAISLGAPFWFQLLSRLVPLRATGGKPKGSTG